MNVLEQLQALGFEEEPLQFYDGGDTDGGQGPGGTDVGAENTADYGGPGLGPGGTELSSEISSTAGGTGRGTVSIAGPVSPESPEVLASYASGRLSNFDWGSPQGKEAASILSQLADLGYGKMEGLNVANPSQSIDNLLASANTAQFGVPLALSVIPGAGFAQALGRGLGSLAAGKTSLADLATDLGLQALAGKIGVPGGVLTGLAKGDVGGALQSAGMGLAQGALSQATGLPGGLIGTGLSLAMGSGAFGGQGGTNVGTGDAGSGGFNFSGVGGAETYSPTEQLQQSFNPMSVAGGYGVNVNDALANVTPGLQKAPYGSMPYSMEV